MAAKLLFAERRKRLPPAKNRIPECILKRYLNKKEAPQAYA
jgi:hypothetical protein